MLDLETPEINLTGISASPGICIGKAYLVDREGVEVVEKYYIPERRIQKEINRFKEAVRLAENDLKQIIADIPEELRQHTDILNAQLVLYEDKMLYGKTIETIEKDMVNAEWALKTVTSRVKEIFKQIDDSYLQARGADVVHVSESIMRNLMGGKEPGIASIDKRVILVAHDLSPADTSRIQLDRIMGLITDRGGKTSHTGIIAGTLGIPCVLGLNNATVVIRTDDILIVDGEAGKVIVHPDVQTVRDYEARRLTYEKRRKAIVRGKHFIAETRDGFRLNVMANIELPEEATTVKEHGGDGIGLLRTEFLYMVKNSFPDEEELFEQYREVARAFHPRVVTIRTLDINGDKAVSYASAEKESNPALGLRAIRFCLKRPEVFLTQLRAILRAAAFGNVRIMFPMISGLEEVLEAKQLLRQAADELKREKRKFHADIEVGIMIEVPSAVILADALAREVDFFSIGTNDLVQYALAIDRGNQQVAHLYQSLHPAVIRMIKTVVDAAHANKIKVSMCGEMASDPIHLPVFLGLGIDELSMNAPAIPAVKNMIKKLSLKESKRLMPEVLKKNTTAEIIDLLHGVFDKILTDEAIPVN